MNPALVIEYVDKINGSKGYAVVDRFINGVAGGGIRIREGLTKEEVIQLAKTMTNKFALLEPQLGGAKFGLDYDPKELDKCELLNRFIGSLKEIFLTCCVTGADLNTTEDEVVSALEAAGVPSPQFALARACYSDNCSIDEAISRLAKGIALPVDGIQMNDAITGYGVCQSAVKALAMNGVSIDQARITIQGFGKVGGSAAKSISKLGGRIIAVSDIEAAILNENALDCEQLLHNRNGYGVIHKGRLPGNYQIVDRDSLLYMPADVLITAAISNVICDSNVHLVKAKIIVEGANNSITPSAMKTLAKRGILVIPDFIASGGAAFLYGALIGNYVDLTVESILSTWDSLIQQNTYDVVTLLTEKGICPIEAAQQLSHKRISEYYQSGGSRIPQAFKTVQLEPNLKLSYNW